MNLSFPIPLYPEGPLGDGGVLAAEGEENHGVARFGAESEAAAEEVCPDN